MGISMAFPREDAGPFRALRKFRKSTDKAIAGTVERLNTRLTRIYLGTATDDDFCAIATYLVYGFVLAKNFRDIDQESFVIAVQELAEAKRLLIKGEVAHDLLDAVSERFEVAKAMVFDLTIGEQEHLQAFVRKNGLCILNKMQKRKPDLYKVRKGE